MGSKADPRLSPSAAAAPAAAVLPVLQGGRAYRFASSLLLRLHAKREREEPQSQQPQRPWLLGGQGPRPAMCHPGNFTVPWGTFREDSAPAPGSAGFGSGSMPAAALFTPYHVTTGGGEKYLLSGRWLLLSPRITYTTPERPPICSDCPCPIPSYFPSYYSVQWPRRCRPWVTRLQYTCARTTHVRPRRPSWPQRPRSGRPCWPWSPDLSRSDRIYPHSLSSGFPWTPSACTCGPGLRQRACRSPGCSLCWGTRRCPR